MGANHLAHRLASVSHPIRLSPAKRVFDLAGCFAALAWLSFGCQSKPISTTAANSGSAAASSTGAATEPLPVPGTQTPNSAVLPTPAVWAVGAWSGAGVAKQTKVKLPGDQGVQLAWIKDDGKLHSGPIDVAFSVSAEGQVHGEVSGALGKLVVSGVVATDGPSHLELRTDPDGLEVFHGTLIVVWDGSRKKGVASLRATSGNGHWLRSAELEVTRGS